MNFLGLGPGELVLIGALGLIIFGPGKLPEIAAQVGRAVRDFRRSTTEITSEFQNSFRLDEPPPPPAPAGPAAPFASSSSAATESSQQSEAGGRASEPPLADTSEWHWESAESTTLSTGSSPDSADGPSQPRETSQTIARGQPVDSSGSFWEWDGSATPAADQASPPTAAEPVPAGSSMWQWDHQASRAPEGGAPPATVSTSREPKVDQPDVSQLSQAPGGKRTSPRRRHRPPARAAERE
jgi:sec-independent protein translocase protein TatA